MNGVGAMRFRGHSRAMRHRHILQEVQREITRLEVMLAMVEDESGVLRIPSTIENPVSAAEVAERRVNILRLLVAVQHAIQATTDTIEGELGAWRSWR